MFGTKHIIVIAVCAAYIAAMLVLLAKEKPPLRLVIRALFAVGIISETLKVFTYIVINEETYGGYLPKTDLPFHLCSVQIIFMLITVLTQNEKVKSVLRAFMLPTCLIGGIAAMLIPTSSSLSNSVITVQYFLYHSSIVVYAVYLCMTDEVRFGVRDWRNALLMLSAFFFIAIYLNSWVNDYSHPVNFMYVVNPPVSGLPYLNKDHGWLVYMIHYAFLAFFAVTMCYIKPVAAALRAKLSAKNG